MDFHFPCVRISAVLVLGQSRTRGERKNGTGFARDKGYDSF